MKPKLEEKGEMPDCRRSWRGWLLLAGAFVLLVSGCSRKLPQEVTDVNQAMSQTKDGCAGIYAADRLGRVQSDVDAMNQLADAKKYRKARNSAEPILPQIEELASESERAKGTAKANADAAVAKLAAAVDKARDAEASTHAAGPFGEAEGKLSEARRLAGDPCRYRDAVAVASGRRSLPLPRRRRGGRRRDRRG